MDTVCSDDVEKRAGAQHADAKHVDASSGVDLSDGVYDPAPTPPTKLQHILSKLKVETRGIERVPEEERTDTSYLNVGSMVLPPSKSILLPPSDFEKLL